MPVYLIMFLLMFSSSVFALPFNNALSFAPPATDLSVIFLGNLFGVVDGVLAGSGSQIFGKMMGVFNASLLALGSIMLMYTIIVGTLYTAQEGEFIGKNWSSIWVPVRMVAGTALLVPKASGYSLIQIFIMWIVIQGVGAADKIWNAALDYLNVGGSLVGVQASSHDTNKDAASQTGGNPTLLAATFILSGQVCMQALQQDLQNQHSNLLQTGLQQNVGVCSQSSTSANPKFAGLCQTPVPDFVSSVNFVDFQSNSPASPQGIYTISMPNFSSDSPYHDLNGVCGEVSWARVNLSVESLKSQFNNSINDAQANAIVLTRAIALQQMYDNLNMVAEQIVNNSPIFSPDANNRSQATPLAFTQFGVTKSDYSTVCKQWNANCQIWGPIGGGDSSVLFTGVEINNAINTYNNVMTPTLNLMQELNDRASFQENRAFIKQSKADGWMMAGSYFFNLIKISGDPLKKQNLTDSNSGLNGSLGKIDASTSPCAEGGANPYCSFLTQNGQIFDFIKGTVTGVTPSSFPPEKRICETGLNVNAASFSSSDSGYIGGNKPNRSAANEACSSTVLGFVANTFYLAIPGQPGLTFPPFPELSWKPFPSSFGSPKPTNACGGINLIFFTICLGRIVTNSIVWPVLSSIMSIITNVVNAVMMTLVNITITIPLQAIIWPLIAEAWSVLTTPSINPIVNLALMGADMISTTFKGVFTMFLTSIGIAAIPVIGTFLLLVVMPLAAALIMPWFIYFMMTGFMTAFYIPLLPYMIFTFGTIAWLIAVIESMVAAPIMALGVMTPEGEGIMGKAEHGFMILLNVFLRPSMMVIGFIMGIVLTYVSVWVLNTGFGRAASYLSSGNSILNYTDYAMVGFLAQAFYVIIYISIYSTIVQKSFNLIQKLPDTVLRWIGGTQESYGESATEWLQEGKQLTQEQAKETAGALEKGAAAQKEGYAEYKESKKTKPDDPGTVNPGGGG